MALGIFDTLKKRRESRAASFHELARDIADGKSVKPELAERILADCEKTAEELENMVATYAERKRKREVVSRADGELTKELAQIETKLAACREKLERAQHEYAETSYPLRQRAQAIESVMSAADSARGQLANMNTHPDETIRDRCRQAQVRRDELQGHVFKVQKMLSHNIKTRAALQAKIEHESAHTIRMRPAADPYGVDADALRQSRMQDEANTCAKEIEAQTEALKQAEKELAQAERDLERATAQLVAN
ncbi:hypothetical protein B7486_16575 [cyanobacterium TDX16]|nr:hypothetical protein B7486_16575 [cyanobacterium TDX16]